MPALSWWPQPEIRQMISLERMAYMALEMMGFPLRSKMQWLLVP
jgi:hypothetical protein